MELARIPITIFFITVVCCVLSCSAGVRRKRWAVDDDGCRTPGRGVGSCVGIYQCKPMLDFMAEHPVIDNRTEKVLDEYICGYENDAPKICCPSTPINLGWMEDDNNCTTPDKIMGKCISIHSCKPLLDVIDNLKNVDADNKRILKAYSCGFNDKNVAKVCCPPPTPITTRLADVSDHKNINLLPLDNCGVTDDLDRIINGNKSRIFEFPWMAALKYLTEQGIDFRCGGTLINDRYVLTAAHCIKTVKMQLIGVRLGEYDLSTETDCEIMKDNKTICMPPVQNFDVTAIDAIAHPNYNNINNANDIALIRLPRAANINGKSVRPVCLPIMPSIGNKGLKKNLVVIGWGATETGYKSPVLLKVKIPVVQNEKCKKDYENIIDIFDTQLCAGGKNNQDSCSGDSGGPLLGRTSDNSVLKTFQYGIVSYGLKLCGLENKPAVYTRITSYAAWILDNIKV